MSTSGATAGWRTIRSTKPQITHLMQSCSVAETMFESYAGLAMLRIAGTAAPLRAVTSPPAVRYYSRPSAARAKIAVDSLHARMLLEVANSCDLRSSNGRRDAFSTTECSKAIRMEYLPKAQEPRNPINLQSCSRSTIERTSG